MTFPQPAKTPAERLMVAASLPEAMRSGFFHEKAKVPGAIGWTEDNEEAVAWLPAMTALGMANLSALDKLGGAIPIPVTASRAREAGQGLLAFLAFVPDCRTQVTHMDPVYGEMNHASKVLVPWTSSALREAVSAHTVMLAAAIVRLREEGVFDSNPEILGDTRGLDEPGFTKIAPTPGHLVPMVSAWMGTLCLLDLPEDVALFAKACPESLQCAIPVDQLGPGFSANIHLLTKKNRADVSPFLCALNASSIACMDALHAAGVETNAELVKVHSDGEPRSFRLTTAFEALWPTCYPFAFSHAVQALADVGPKQAVIALEAMLQTAGAARGRAPLAEGLVHAGMFDHRPEVAIGWALTNGQSNVLKRFEHNFPWAKFAREKHGIAGHIHSAGSPGLMREGEGGAERENALMKLFEIARRDAREDAVFHTYSWKNNDAKPGAPANQELALQPFCSLARSGFTRAVAAYVLNGLDVTARPDDRTATPMEFIKALGKKGNDVAHAVRTAVNHLAAQKAMQDMLAEDPAPPVALRA